jgi:hypothetical protein
MEQFCHSDVVDSAGDRCSLGQLIKRGCDWAVFGADNGEIARILHVQHPVQRDSVRERVEWLSLIASKDVVLVPRRILSLAPPFVGYTFKPISGARRLEKWLALREDTSGFNLLERLRLGRAVASAFAALPRVGVSLCALDLGDLYTTGGAGKAEVFFTKPENLGRPGRLVSYGGEPRYLAPEINRCSHQPDRLSDSFSVATIIFELLRLAHPFLGSTARVLTEEYVRLAVRGELPDVDHPDHPQYGRELMLLADWTCTPGLKTLFRRAFVDGQLTRCKRPNPEEFIEACGIAEDLCVQCPECGCYFYGNRTKTPACTWCEKSVPSIPQLVFFDVVHYGERGQRKMIYRKLDDQKLYLRPGETQIRARHLRYDKTENPEQVCVVAENSAGEVSVRNCSLEHMRVFFGRKDGSKRVEIGSQVMVRPGCQLYFSAEENLKSIATVMNEPATGMRVAKLLV